MEKRSKYKLIANAKVRLKINEYFILANTWLMEPLAQPTNGVIVIKISNKNTIGAIVIT